MSTDVSENGSAALAIGFDRSLLLTPIRGGNTFEETVERILQTVRLGLIHPGEQLPPERELATMLEISRDTVRDAIASLSEAGYLAIRRGRYGGTFVADSIPAGPIVIDGGVTVTVQDNQTWTIV